MIIPKIKYVFDRRKKASSTAKGSVELRITVGRKQKFMSMRISLYPKEWDLKTESVKARFDAPELNVMLQDTKKNVLRMIMGMKDDIDIDFIFNNLKKCELIDLNEIGKKSPRSLASVDELSLIFLEFSFAVSKIIIIFVV